MKRLKPFSGMGHPGLFCRDLPFWVEATGLALFYIGKIPSLYAFFSEAFLGRKEGGEGSCLVVVKLWHGFAELYGLGLGLDRKLLEICFWS